MSAVLNTITFEVHLTYLMNDHQSWFNGLIRPENGIKALNISRKWHIISAVNSLMIDQVLKIT